MISKNLVTLIILATAYFISKLLRIETTQEEAASDQDCLNFRKENLERNQASLLVASTIYTNEDYLAAVMRQYSNKLNFYILPLAEKTKIKSCLKNKYEMMLDAEVKVSADCEKFEYLEELLREEIMFTESYKSEAASKFLFSNKPMYRRCMLKKNANLQNTIGRALCELLLNILNVFGPGDIFEWIRWLDNSETKNSAVLLWLCVMIIAFYMGDLTIVTHMMAVYLFVTSSFKLGLGVGFGLSLVDGIALILLCRQDWVRGMGLLRH